MKTRTKEQITAELAPLQAELHRLKDAEAKAESLKRLGRCFKYRNCYSCPKPDEFWWLYVKVVSIGEYWPQSFEFQTDKDGSLSVKTNDCCTLGNRDGYQEITVKEFNAAWRAVQKRIARTQP